VSAECHDCGADLVYAPTDENWQNMECVACSQRAVTQQFLSAFKVWRNATESRLRHLDSRGEAAKSMLFPDRAFIEEVERIEAGFSHSKEGER
jgi:hypothetical protein